MKPKILVIIPSLNRPGHLADCISTMLHTASQPFDILVVSRGGGVYNAINKIPHALLAQYQILGIRDDDSRMRSSGWDDLVLGHLSGGVGLVYGKDGMFNESLATYQFMSSEIPLTLGFIYPSCFYHYAGDNYLHELAQACGILHYEPGIVSEHLQNHTDDNYLYGKSRQAEDGRALEEYRKTKFLEDVEKIKSCVKFKQA